MLNAAWFVLAGMGMVFATLALLVVVMMALNRWVEPRAGTAPARRGSDG